MTVFKGYLKGALRQKIVILLYLVIFLGLGTLMTMSMDENPTGNYEAQSLKMAVIDRDQTSVSKGLDDYLGESQDLVKLKDDRKVLQEELYYGNIQYVLIIPEGFEKALEESGTDQAKDLLEGTGRPGSNQSYYAKELAEGYLTGISVYLDAGYTSQEAVKGMAALESQGSTVELAEGSSSMSKVAGTFQYLPYILTALSCYVIGFVMLDYQRLEIRRRLAVSAVSFAQQLVQMLFAFLVIGLAFYVVSFLMVGLMNPHQIFQEPNIQYYAMNVATMVVVGLSIAFLVVHVAGTANGVNGLANVIALGMSFICGVFIPESMLSSSVKNLARFLPVYWYE
ncbi:MAG: ABC transporter permease, partial [Blautia sp.]